VIEYVRVKVDGTQ